MIDIRQLRFLTERVGASFRRPIVILGVILFASLLCGVIAQSQTFLISEAAFVVTSIGLIGPWVSVQGVRAEAKFRNRRD